MSYSIPSMPAFQPQIYSVGSKSLFEQYDTVNNDASTPFVTTPIPGAGYQHVALRARGQALDLGGLHGLGATGDQAAAVVNVVAGLLVDPQRELERRGPALVAALDEHVVVPLMDSMMVVAEPYLVRYVAVPLAVIGVASIAAAYFAYHADNNTKKRST